MLLMTHKCIDNVILLESIGIKMVSNLLDADMESLLSIKGLDEEKLDLIYEAVQNFIERKVEDESVSDMENEINLNNADKS